MAAKTVLLALLAHAGANVLNDYCDAMNGADAANSAALFPFTGGPLHSERPGVHRWHQLLLVVTTLGGIWLVLQSGAGLLLVGMVGLLLAWAHSAQPFKLMSCGLGEFAAAAPVTSNG